MQPTDLLEVTITDRRTDAQSRWKIFLPSITTLGLTLFFIFGLLMNGDIKPITKRGFFCDDSSINYPFKQETIDIKFLMLIALIIPSIVIKVCEKSLYKLLSQDNIGSHINRRRKRRKVSDGEEEIDVEEEELISDKRYIKRRHLTVNDVESDYQPINPRISDDGEVDLFTPVSLDSDQENVTAHEDSILANYVLSRKFSEVQLFIFGFSTTMLFTGIGKITCGRLRPHFLQRCQPRIDCSQLEQTKRYIEDYTCNEQLKSREFSYITTSWPSGHAAIMFYSMLYLIIYLQNIIPLIVQLSSQRVRLKFDPLILYALYVLMIGLAGFIAMTRVSDFHHHPLDVFSGSVIGTVIAIGLAKSFLKHHSLQIA